MKVLIFGGSGKTGRLVIRELLDKNHQVTAYVRNASKLSIQDKNLVVIEDLISNTLKLEEAMVGIDCVISCLGSATMKPNNELEILAKGISEAMSKSHIQRVVYMASAGIHGEIKGIPGWIVNLILGNVLKDHKAAIDHYINRGLNYTIVRPMQLTDGPKTNKYHLAETGIPKGGRPVSRSDVAAFIVEVLDNQKYNMKSIGISQ